MESQSVPAANGLKTLVDTIIAPKEAFESLRTAPTWGWAFIIGVPLAMLGSYLTVPAMSHALTAAWPTMVAHNPQLAQLTPAQQQTQLALVLKFAQFGWIALLFMMPFFMLLQALLLTVFNALGHGSGTFKQYWAAAVNISVPAFALYSIVAAVIGLARGPESFSSQSSFYSLMPSLALFAPDGGIKLTAALSTINPFSIWGAVLAALALLVIGRTPRLQAILAGALWLLIPTLFSFATAR